MRNLILIIVILVVAALAYWYFVDPTFFGLVEQAPMEQVGEAAGDGGEATGDAAGDGTDEQN